MEEFLRKLGIYEKPVESDDGCYVIDIEDSDDFGRIYSKLDRSDLVDEDEDASQVALDSSSIQFTSDEYLLTLLADLEGDTYSLVIRPNR